MPIARRCNGSSAGSSPNADHGATHRPLGNPRVDQIEVLLPRRVVVRDLPGPLDPFPVLGELTGKALGELEWREVLLRPLERPAARVEGHLVDACDAALVEVVLEERAAALVPADDREPVWRFGDGN